MRKIFLLMYVLLSLLFTAQSGGTSESLNKITPLSPNSAAFEKYGTIPVNLSAGVITPSIPLFNIQAGTNNFNVAINYSSQGLRVDELPTNLGMGWSLNLGSITRSIKDLPDENFPRISEIGTISGDDNFYIGNSLANDIIDSERDIFTLNVDGYSTKFILDNPDEINISVKKVTLDDIKIKILITPNLLATDKSNTPKLQVVTPNGNKYYFGGNGGVETSFVRSNSEGSTPPASGDLVTGWMLSKIEYPDGKDVNIFYSNTILSYIDGISQTAEIRYKVPTSTETGSPQLMPPNTLTNYFRTRIVTPSYITYGKSKIVFETGNFIDVVPNTNFPKITNITVYSIKDEPSISDQKLKSIFFDYNSYPSISIGTNNYSTNTNRPFLSKIKFNDYLQNTIYEYNLQYNNPDKLPHRMSFSQDILGYYNGKNNKKFIFNSLKDYSYFPGFV